MAWMQTYTGRAVDPTDLRLVNVSLADIAHALSHLCRFAGHAQRYYSVADHSVYVSMVVPPAVARLALLHDASEAYLVDIPRPIKPLLAGYAELEHRATMTILASFGIAWSPDQWDIVKHADNAVLAAERDQVMGPPIPGIWAALPDPPAGLVIVGLAPVEARALFLARCAALGIVE